MKRAIIVGAGGFGREIACWARMCSGFGTEWALAGYIDDNLDSLRGKGSLLPLLGTISEHVPQQDELFLSGIGQPRLRREIVESLLRRGARFLTLIHQTAIVADAVSIGGGTVVCPYAVVSCNAKLGRFVVVNCHATVDHDAAVGDFTQINLHCDVTGGAIIGDEVFMGSHASILPGIRVADRAIVGAGAVVTRDVDADTTVVGVPARPVARVSDS